MIDKEFNIKNKGSQLFNNKGIKMIDQKIKNSRRKRKDHIKITYDDIISLWEMLFSNGDNLFEKKYNCINNYYTQKGYKVERIIIMTYYVKEHIILIKNI